MRIFEGLNSTDDGLENNASRMAQTRGVDRRVGAGG